MTNLLRIDPTKMDFGWNPDQRVPKITEALNEQRANLRAATDRHNIDVATRNVADLEKTLERAQTNEAARQKHIQEIEAARATKQQENDARALAAITTCTWASNGTARPPTPHAPKPPAPNWSSGSWPITARLAPVSPKPRREQRSPTCYTVTGSRSWIAGTPRSLRRSAASALFDVSPSAAIDRGGAS